MKVGDKVRFEAIAINGTGHSSFDTYITEISDEGYKLDFMDNEEEAYFVPEYSEVKDKIDEAIKNKKLLFIEYIKSYD